MAENIRPQESTNSNKAGFDRHNKERPDRKGGETGGPKMGREGGRYDYPSKEVKTPEAPKEFKGTEDRKYGQKSDIQGGSRDIPNKEVPTGDLEKGDRDMGTPSTEEE